MGQCRTINKENIKSATAMFLFSIFTEGKGGLVAYC